MQGIGIIAEFNPLHKGHEYLISKAKQQGTVVCVMSGNFVQRGDTAIAEKRVRTQAALKAGADLILELPVLWSMSTAQNFALGGVSALKYAGCRKMIFGSEYGNTDELFKTSRILSSPDYISLVLQKSKHGVTFASARQSAAETLGVKKGILQGANNNLGIEYITAAKSLNYNVEFETVKRIGSDHDSMQESEFVSAALLREHLKKQDYDFCSEYMSKDILNLFSHENISDISNIETGILAVLRTKTIEELRQLPDLSEGVENKLFYSISIARSLEELYNTMKVKRYTLARIRRLVLSAFLGADNSFFMKPVPYLRVLGFSQAGEKYIKENFKNLSVPLINRVSDTEKLGGDVKKIFETESRATDLFLLSLNTPQKSGLEYKAKIIKTGC